MKEGDTSMNDDTKKLVQRIEELSQENERLSEIIKKNGLPEDENKDFPLHDIWFEEGKYAGI